MALYEGIHGILGNDFIHLKNGSLDIITDVQTGDLPVNGVMFHKMAVSVVGV